MGNGNIYAFSAIADSSKKVCYPTAMDELRILIVEVWSMWSLVVVITVIFNHIFLFVGTLIMRVFESVKAWLQCHRDEVEILTCFNVRVNGQSLTMSTNRNRNFCMFFGWTELGAICYHSSWSLAPKLVRKRYLQMPISKKKTRRRVRWRRAVERSRRARTDF